MAQYCLIKEAESEKYRAGRNSEADPCYEPDSNDPDKLSRGEKIAIAGVAATIAGALITAIVNTEQVVGRTVEKTGHGH